MIGLSPLSTSSLLLGSTRKCAPVLETVWRRLSDNDSKGGPADPQAAPREFLSDLVARAAPMYKGAHRGGGGGIPVRRLDEERRGPGADAEHRASLEDPGLRTRQGTRRGGEEFPGKTAGGSIHVRLARRAVCEVLRRWRHRQCGVPRRDRGRGRCRLAGIPV